ncbi:MAG: hypothetical protein COA88_11805 [Kordia sp.]|nr:MAG: hypothetical protein COA88_11805 [Kordia sp.]
MKPNYTIEETNTNLETALLWHPKFRVYRMENGDVLLNSELLPLCLSHKENPFLSKVGSENLDDIVRVNNELSFEKHLQSLYQVNLLKKQGIIIDANRDTDIHNQYINKRIPEVQQLVTNESYSITNLSAAKQSYIKEWAELIKTIINPLQSSVHFFLIDDFFDDRLASLLDKNTADTLSWCLLKITGVKLWFTPISTQSAPISFTALQKRLLHNQPVLQLAKRLYPKENHLLPFRNQQHIPEVTKNLIVQSLNKQLRAKQSELIIIDIQQQNSTPHPLVITNESQSTFVRQINAPVLLQSCPINFDEDGGSRYISPEETLERLKAFISPCTGVITHLSEHKASIHNLVKIYYSSFFKTPSIHDVHNINNQSFVQTCMGKGVSSSQSQASALCETIERYAALYHGDEPLLLNRPSELSERFYNYHQLAPYSTQQYLDFKNTEHPDSKRKQAVTTYKATDIHWCPTWSLTQKEHVYVPMSLCFNNVPFGDTKFGHWHSNGCAAGNTLEEAILQSLFELIERDAIAIWWYNQIVRPGFDVNRIPKSHQLKLDETLSASQNYWVLDLTTDIGIPVMVAIAQEKITGGYSFGFGCHLHEELAAQRALTELCQLLPIRDQENAPFNFNAVQEGSYLHPQNNLNISTRIAQSSGDLKKDVDAIVEQLKYNNLEVLVLNYTRAPLPINTAKVFVPGLCHMWPQLANKRLYQIPVHMGWLKQEKRESALNLQALYI